jgi:hypothetical protein
MSIRKIYTNGELELELTWSDKGIHLNINHFIIGELPSTEFIIEESDVNEFYEDIKSYSLAVIQENRIIKSSVE